MSKLLVNCAGDKLLMNCAGDKLLVGCEVAPIIQDCSELAGKTLRLEFANIVSCNCYSLEPGYGGDWWSVGWEGFDPNIIVEDTFANLSNGQGVKVGSALFTFYEELGCTGNVFTTEQVDIYASVRCLDGKVYVSLGPQWLAANAVLPSDLQLLPNNYVECHEFWGEEQPLELAYGGTCSVTVLP